MKELLEFYKAFFRIGLFTFGGGYAMLPCCRRKRWSAITG
jgi:chromate transport protein ChrA